MFIILHKEVEG